MNKQIQAVMDQDTETFSYVVWEANKQAIVIDPVLDFHAESGRTSTTTADRLIEIVRSQNLQVKYILETHAHADHLSAAPYLKEQVGGLIGIGEHITEVQAHFRTVFGLEKQMLPNGSEFDLLLKDGDVLSVGDMQIHVMHTPGHTYADVAYRIDDAVFVGDTLFMPDVGTARCDFPGGDAAQLYDSIQALLSLPDDTSVFVCHDYPKDRKHRYQTSVLKQREENIHVGGSTTKEQFVRMREERDKTLGLPRYIIPSIQVNMRAGRMPEPDEAGRRYLKVPLNML